MELIDRNEIEEPRVTEAPQCWPHKSLYWTCRGNTPEKPKPKTRWWQKEPEPEPKKKTWTVLSYTQEDAEASACQPHETGWIWNGQPAVQISLRDSMFETRKLGRIGIEIMSFVNGQWVTVRKYKATEPLPEE